MRLSQTVVQPFSHLFFILLKTAYHPSHSLLLSAPLLVAYTTLQLLSYHPLKNRRQEVMSRGGGGLKRMVHARSPLLTYWIHRELSGATGWKMKREAPLIKPYCSYYIKLFPRWLGCHLGISTIFLCDLRREQTQPVGGQSIYFLLISLLRLVEAWGAWSLIHKNITELKKKHSGLFQISECSQSWEHDIRRLMLCIMM